MTLKDNEKNWVQGQIRVSADALTRQIAEATQRPEVRGLKKAFRWMRDWSLIAATIGAAVTVIVFSANNAIQDAYFRGATNESLKSIQGQNANIDQRLKSVEADVLSLRARQAALNPTDKAN